MLAPLFVFLFVLLYSLRIASLTQCNVSPLELSVLQDLYVSTSGDSWTWKSNSGLHWDFSTADPNPCHPPWQGIVCSNQSLLVNSSTVCQVLSIQLQQYNLVGTIPSSIGNLSGLATFQLNYNSLNGTIPSTIGSLPLLSVLELVVNELTGSLPASFAAATSSLSHIYLYANYLTGHLPPDLFNFTDSALTYVEINDNFFSGPLPEMSLSKLIYMDISMNRLSGTIANTINLSKSLELMYVYDNSLSGTFPDAFGDISTFQQIEGYGNEFTGTLPQKWSSAMININFCPSYFSGSVLSSMVNLTSIQALILCFSTLTGTIPKEFSNFNNMTDLVLQDNAFSGSVNLIGLPAVQYLQFQGNVFSGSISYTPTGTQSFAFIDFSSNQFTGTLPVSLFTDSLVSFAASTNCLSGSIPVAFCGLPNLVYLGLDGLSTATHCRDKLFPHIPSIKSFSLKESTVGGIPECLFSIPILETLLVSGNSIDWKFPSDLNISRTLTQLSLSHNKITGTIPLTIQQRDWVLLDLSYNRLSGTLTSDNGFTKNTSLTLRVNRLSGAIPNNVKQLESVNILSGNLFGCDFARRSLPLKDPSHSKYQCGSNTFNQSIIMWLCFCGAILLALLLGWSCASTDFKGMQGMWILFAQWQKYYCSLEQLPNEHLLLTFQSFLLESIQYVLRSSALVVVVGLVLYGSLNVSYGTADNQYAWTVSAAFLSGLVPAILMLSYFLVLLLIVIGRLHATHNHRIHDSGSLTGWERLSLLLLVFVNCCIMIAVNGCYVAILLTYNTQVAFTCQIAMSFFKLTWNDLVVRRSVKMMRRFHQVEDALLNKDLFVRKELVFTAFMVLFNTIIAPCLATAAVDPNCFFDVIVAPAAVTSNLPVVSETRNCEQELRANGSVIEVCGNYTSSVQYLSDTYNPPFIYSYQCSSSILTNYASVYVYMFLLVAFVKPFALCICAHWYQTLARHSCLHVIVRKLMYRILKHFEDIEPDEEIFQLDTFVLRMIAKVAILLTFGVVFPPLAVIICVAFLSEAYLHLVIIGRFLLKIEMNEERLRLADVLGRICIDCPSLVLQPLIQLVLPLSALFLSMFVFDTYGNAEGFQKALWAPILLTLTPWICRLVSYALGKYPRQPSENENGSKAEKADFELKSI